MGELAFLPLEGRGYSRMGGVGIGTVGEVLFDGSGGLFNLTLLPDMKGLSLFAFCMWGDILYSVTPFGGVGPPRAGFSFIHSF